LKVAIIGLPRSKSSYLIDIVSRQFKLDNKFEELIKYQSLILNTKVFHPDSNFQWERYKINLGKNFQKISSESNYAIKIFPSLFINHLSYKNIHYNFADNYFAKENFINDLGFINLELYNQIYIIDRHNLTDLVISWLLGHYNDQFLHLQDFTIKKFNLLHNLNLEDAFIKFAIYVMMTQKVFIDKIKQFLNRFNVRYVDLNYDNVEQYIDSKGWNSTSMFIKTYFNYSDHPRYQEFKFEISKIYDEVNLRFRDFNFVCQNG
jgi:hypothetical protein